VVDPGAQDEGEGRTRIALIDAAIATGAPSVLRVLLHLAIQRGLLGATALGVEREPSAARLGLPADGLHALLMLRLGLCTNANCATRRYARCGAHRRVLPREDRVALGHLHQRPGCPNRTATSTCFWPTAGADPPTANGN
jgi:hypothetical protein